MTDLSIHATALAGLVRRPLAVSTTTSVRANFTHSRYIEMTVEADGAVSAWGVGSIEIAGKLVDVAVYLGDALDNTGAIRLLSRAKVLVAEVIGSGSKAATFHGDGTLLNGRRVYIYAAPQLHEPLALARVASYITRNKIAMKEAETVPAKKTVAKKKAAA